MLTRHNEKAAARVSWPITHDVLPYNLTAKQGGFFAGRIERTCIKFHSLSYYCTSADVAP